MCLNLSQQFFSVSLEYRINFHLLTGPSQVHLEITKILFGVNTLLVHPDTQERGSTVWNLEQTDFPQGHHLLFLPLEQFLL